MNKIRDEKGIRTDTKESQRTIRTCLKNLYSSKLEIFFYCKIYFNLFYLYLFKLSFYLFFLVSVIVFVLQSSFPTPSGHVCTS